MSEIPAREIFSIGGDLQVSRIGYGAMRLADGPEPAPSAAEAHIWRPPAGRAGAIALLRRAAELGVDLFDTADAYALGANEELIAEALHPYAGSVTIATKIGVLRPSPTEWVTHGHPAYLRQQAELALRRLRVERIDLLQLHRIDPEYPLADQIGALKQLRDEGKVRHIGLSEVGVDELRRAAEITPIASVQNLYNLSTRDHDPVVDYAAERGIAFLPWFPFAAGSHAGPGSPLAEVAAEIGVTAAQASLAWLLRRSPTVIPIPGTSSIAHLEENVAALSVKLTDDQYDRLSRAV
ncbi:aryl-alcohol dehydrogenase-like predicted oxidoreductase [Nonomuraea thailandensis]|uniref:Aryl-alcohol dehydrogenase-like predicted oxidoreductase n=1 Tax=Nonomuraea thailandensis TaxID=1188745 RepID=A0A9X2GL76_9ACTN|nr:aldo/keto reductase [Nonomuraea thailandensis]MCP2359614.1 aryl-alcohol dehydrogenase-like predicted oxidoreductase [Nonomuraea thailandensis]